MADDGDDRAAFAATSAAVEARLQGLSSVGLDPDRDLAAARQADVPGVRVRNAVVQQLWRAAGQHSLGDLDDSAFDAPA